MVEEGVSGDIQNFTLTSDLLDFFNLRRTYKTWPDILKEEVIKSENCSNDFEEYFRGLQEQKIWALKSELDEIKMINSCLSVVLLGFWVPSPHLLRFVENYVLLKMTTNSFSNYSQSPADLDGPRVLNHRLYSFAAV